MNVNINNLRRVSCYHDSELRSKANWIEKNNNFNVMHLMSDCFVEGKATREEIEQTYFNLLNEGLSQVFEVFTDIEDNEFLEPYNPNN